MQVCGEGGVLVPLLVRPRLCPNDVRTVTQGQGWLGVLLPRPPQPKANLLFSARPRPACVANVPTLVKGLSPLTLQTQTLRGRSSRAPTVSAIRHGLRRGSDHERQCRQHPLDTPRPLSHTRHTPRAPPSGVGEMGDGLTTMPRVRCRVPSTKVSAPRVTGHWQHGRECHTHITRTLHLNPCRRRVMDKRLLCPISCQTNMNPCRPRPLCRRQNVPNRTRCCSAVVHDRMPHTLGARTVASKNGPLGISKGTATPRNPNPQQQTMADQHQIRAFLLTKTAEVAKTTPKCCWDQSLFAQRAGLLAINAQCAGWYFQVYVVGWVFRRKLYCLRQVHLAENLL